MKDSKFLLITIVVLVALNICSLGYLILNNRHAPMGPPPRERVVDMMIDHLGLSKEQEEKVRALHESHLSRMEEITSGDRKMHDDYFDLVAVVPVDSAKINSMAEQMAQNRKLVELETFYYFNSIRSICTPVQQEKFQRIMHDALHAMGPQNRRRD